jgi:CDP-glycerol glycerophosphotransferase (TagB/SpsB family)
MKRDIEVEKPDLILITCGYCQLGRAAVIAGKLKGVPTLELQHGIIHPYHEGYIYTKDEITHDDGVTPYCPIPDKTAVYGPYCKNVLTKVSVYPEDSVVITGQPRYDFLYRIDEIFDKETICKDLDLNPNKGIIVLATQGFQPKYGYPDYDRQLLDAVFNSMNDFPDIQLVIKLHPVEDGELQRKMIAERKLKNVLIIKNELYEILSVCDILMSINSTVAIEATILDKPVIIVNLADIPDWMPYVESGVARGVYRKGDLTPAIKDVLENSEVREKLKENRKKFVYEHAYIQDGKATERVVNLIEKMIQESKHNR